MRTFWPCCVVALWGCGPSATPPQVPDDGGSTFDAGALFDAGRPPCGSEVVPAEGVVVTSSGAVAGVLQGDVNRFLGIPYAQAPVGALRWRAPLPTACWPQVRPANAFGAVCPQQLGDGGLVGAEDCLTLNVFAPVGVAGAPVMVWIHGGGNVQGSSSDPIYDGQELASREGVVVVSLNYRLGALGFFTHPALNAENDAGVSGNYGLLDQQAALGWVQANARAFGGDPARVLIFGESAGGQDTLLHLVAPGSKGLFSAAVAQSGGIYPTTLGESVVSLQPVMGAVGCATAAVPLDCLRAVTADQLAGIDSAAGPLARGMRYGPVIDGVVLPDHPLELIKQGKQHGVPVIIGSNAQETSRMVQPVSTQTEYASAVRAQYGVTVGDQLLTQYPASRFNSPREALVTLTTDATWTCPMRRLARALSVTQAAPVYRYFFTWRSPGPVGALIGATHGLEIPFVFRSFGALSFTPGTGDLALSDTMQGAWSSLASTGTPASATGWPRFPVGGDAALVLGAQVSTSSGVRTVDCDFIDQLN